MKYTVRKLSLEEAKNSILEYDFALVYLLEQILLGKTEEIKDEICWEECLEARFFSRDAELHMFDYNGVMSAVRVEDCGEGDAEHLCSFRTFELAGQFQRSGYHSCTAKEYIRVDDDGQAVVELTRLAGLE